MMINIMDLGDAREVSVGIDSQGYVGLEFKIIQYGSAEPTLVRVGLHPARAGHLLELLMNIHKQAGFPLPSGSIVTETPQ